MYTHIKIEVLWRLREFSVPITLPDRSLWPVQRQINIPEQYTKRQIEWHNLITTFGLTALAGASPATYLVIDTASTVLASLVNAGATSISTNADPTLGGDSQLVLGVDGASQETVTFSSKSGTGPYTFTLSSPTLNAHAQNDFVARAPTAADTIASVLSEAQYDTTYFPNQRSPLTAEYSSSSGTYTYQFFLAGTQATNLFFSHVGLADSITIGQGNLHNYSTLGYNHNNTDDFEIDATYILTGM